MEVEVTNGQNIIQLQYDGFASCLVIESALTVNWPDCAGSVGEYYALSNYSSSKRRELTDGLNRLLIEGTETEITESIKSFLTLFSNGQYNVYFKELCLDKSNFFYERQVRYSDNVPEKKRFSGAFYPYPYDKSNYFFTIPNDSINIDRVEFYKTLIQNGSRPKVITYELFDYENAVNTACYLLDGHHKIAAYITLEMDIPAVQIVKSGRTKEQTHDILSASSKILKDFEFVHFLINNDENLESLNITDDEFLTVKLDNILKGESRLGTGIIKLFIRLNKSARQEELEWLTRRLKILSKNKNIGKGLVLYHFGFSEHLNCDCWTFDEINNSEDFKKWLSKTLPNKS